MEVTKMAALESILDQAHPVLLEVSTGEHFDYRSILVFKQLCTEKLEGDAHVIVDMTHTRYVDNSGIALLHCLQHWIDAPKVKVSVTNCRPEIYQILNCSRLLHNILINP
jgi:anti-anti-sigma factor